MKRITLFIAVLSIGLLPICVQGQFAGTGGFSANAVLWFYGTQVTARFTGEMTLSGSVDLDGESIQFNGRGALHGEAEGDSASLTGVGWGIFNATGRTATGAEIELFGGLTADTGDVSFSGEASGTGTADFFVLIVIAGERFEAVGTASASASGDFVPPEDPYTMELSGSGGISFRAGSITPVEDRSVTASDLPWNLTDWPAELRGELLSLLDVKEAEDEPSGAPDEPSRGDDPTPE